MHVCLAELISVHRILPLEGIGNASIGPEYKDTTGSFSSKM